MDDGTADDTDPKMIAKQIALLRKATTAERFSRARSLSETTIQLSRRAIRRAMPDSSEQELLLAFASSQYGERWADRLRSRIGKR